MERHREEQALGELFGEFSAEMRTLVRDEVDLAKAEMSNKMTRIKKDIAYLAAGVLIAYSGLLGLVAFFIIIIGDRIPLWASALIVSIVVGGIGYFFVRRGMSDLKSRSFVPRQTVETLEEDRKWLENQTR